MKIPADDQHSAQQGYFPFFCYCLTSDILPKHIQQDASRTHFFSGRTHGSLAPTGFYRPVSTFSPSAFKLPHTCVYVYHVYHIRARAAATLDLAQYCVHCWRLDIFVSYEMQWFLPQSGLWGWPIVNCVHQVTRQVSTDSRAALDSNL